MVIKDIENVLAFNIHIKKKTIMSNLRSVIEGMIKMY